MEQFVTIQELLAMKPLNRATVAAGWLGRRNPVVRVVSHAKHEDCALSGALVIIEEQGDRLVQAAGEYLTKPVTAILLAGRNMILPQLVIDLAEKKQIPLILLQEALGADDIGWLLELTLTLKARGKLYDFAETVPTEDFAAMNNWPFLLEDLQRYLCNPVVLVSPAFEVLACGGGDKCGPLELNTWVRDIQLFEYRRKKSADGAGDQILKGQFTVAEGETADYYIDKLAVEKTVYGYLLVFEIQEQVNEMDLCRIRQTGILCLRELVSHQKHKEIEDKYKSQFVYDLLHNNYDNAETMIQRAKFWGWDLSVPHQLFIIEYAAIRPAENKAEIMEQLLTATASALRSNCRQAIVCEQMGQVVVIIPEKETSPKKRKYHITNLALTLRQYIHSQMPGIFLRFGVGRFYVAAGDLCRSYQEAKHALELGMFMNHENQITFFEDLGIERLLANVSYEMLDDYYKEYLSPIADYDEKNGVNFQETLMVYFQQNGDLNQTAEQLYLHPNTLRYRLKKIEELLDTDLQSFDKRINLYLACKIAKIRQTNI